MKKKQTISERISSAIKGSPILSVIGALIIGGTIYANREFLQKKFTEIREKATGKKTDNQLDNNQKTTKKNKK